MLNLILTTDKLSLITDSTATVDVHASFADLSGTTVTPGKQNTAISTATTTDIVSVPGASTVRNVKTLHIRNKHAETAANVTVQYNANAVLYELHKATLQAGEALEYVEGQGFFTLGAASGSQTLAGFARLRVTLDVVNATTSFADITGLTVALTSGIFYCFQAHLYHVNDATTTGSRFGYNIGAVPTTAIIGSMQTTVPHVSAGIFAGGVVTARDTVITATTGGSNLQHLSVISGMIQPSANGTFAMRCASEVAVAAGLTVKAGSWLQIWESDN